MVKLPKSFEKMGAIVPPTKPNYRLLLNTEGTPGSGKSHFFTTAPQPIFVADFDEGLEGMIEKHIEKGKVIGVYTCHLPRIPLQDLCIKQWEKFREVWMGILSAKEARTVVIDGGAEMWELIRLAEFGKLSQVPSHLYTNANAAYKGIIKAAYNAGVNLIVTHRLRKVYEEVVENNKKVRRPTGEWERAGFSDDTYLIQANIRHDYDIEAGAFKATITEKCRQNPTAIGFELTGDDVSFSQLGQVIYPDSKPGDWK